MYVLVWIGVSLIYMQVLKINATSKKIVRCWKEEKNRIQKMEVRINSMVVEINEKEKEFQFESL